MDNPETDVFGGEFQSYESALNWLKTNVSFEFFAEGDADSQWSFMRELGLPVTRQDYRDIRRGILGYEFHQRDILSLSDADYIPPEYYYDRHGLELSGDYLYKFDVELYDQRSGKTISGTRSMISNDEDSVGNLTDAMVEKLERTGTDSDIIVMSIQLKGALARV